MHGAVPISTVVPTIRNENSLARKVHADNIHKLVRQRIGQYPYLAVATGAGIAWVLAGGLSARKTRRILGAVGGLALFSPILSRLIGMGATVLDPRG